MKLFLKSPFWLLPAFLSAIALPLRADMVILDSGRAMTGIVEEDTDRHLVLRIGGGRIRFDRDRVAEVRYGDPAEHDRILNAWRQKHFLARSFVPPSQRLLAGDFRQLLRDRARLSEAARERRLLETKERKLLMTGESLNAEMAEANRRLAAAQPNEDPTAYNLLVTAVNNVNYRLRRQQLETDRIRATMATLRQQSNVYIQRFEEVRQHHRRAAAANPDELEYAFLQAMETRLRELALDFNEIQAVIETHGSVKIANVRVNDRASGRMIVDTGASVVTLGSDFAERCGIPLPAFDAPTITMTTADGRQVKAHPVVLQSLTVGGHTEPHVAAVIFPEPPGENIDGLLGMSFLGRFHVSLDGSQHMVLRRFDPN